MASSVTKDELMAYCRVDDDTLGEICVMIADAVEAELASIGVLYDPTAEIYPSYKLMVLTQTAQRLDDPAGAAEIKDTSALYRRYSQLYTDYNLISQQEE